MLTWDDSMSTGVPHIDAQHKELFDKYNELAVALENSSGASRVATGELLDFLQFYAAWHFEREEECMAKHQCPAAEANKRAHAKFIEMFGEFYEKWQVSDTDLELVQETFAELGAWIKDHIMGIDTQLRHSARE